MAPAILGGLAIRLDDLDPAMQSRGYFPSSNWKPEIGPDMRGRSRISARYRTHKHWSN
jgi:hypothetical protein